MRRYLFYVTDFNRNGHQDLIVTDVDGNIIDRCKDGIYGLHVRPEKGQIALNTVVVTDPEMRKSLLDAPEDLTFVYQTNPHVCKRHIAVGPDANEEKTKEFIAKYDARK